MRDYTPRPKSEKPEKKKKKPLRRTAIKKKFKPTGELDLMKKIFLDRATKIDDVYIAESFVDGSPIYDPVVSNFAHVLSKKQYPKFRLYEKNIQIMTYDQHKSFDQGSREDLRKLREWDKVFELEAELKIEYSKL